MFGIRSYAITGIILAVVGIVVIAFLASNEEENGDPTRNLDSLITVAEKDGRLEDAKMMRLQKERKQYNHEPKDPPLSGSDHISKYKMGTYEQKIGLCEALVKKARETSSTKVTTLDLYNCIEEATKGVEVNMTVAEVATLCIVLIEKM